MLVPIGKFVGIFGVRGELKFRPTPAGQDALHARRKYALGPEAQDGDVTVGTVRLGPRGAIVALYGVSTPEAARPYVGRELYAEREAVTAALGPGEYLDADLIGLQLIDSAGKVLGDVVAVEHYPAQDCLVVGPARALVPMVRAFIGDIDLAAKTIVVDLPEGLL